MLFSLQVSCWPFSQIYCAILVSNFLEYLSNIIILQTNYNIVQVVREKLADLFPKMTYSRVWTEPNRCLHFTYRTYLIKWHHYWITCWKRGQYNFTRPYRTWDFIQFSWCAIKSYTFITRLSQSKEGTHTHSHTQRFPILKSPHTVARRSIHPSVRPHPRFRFLEVNY